MKLDIDLNALFGGNEQSARDAIVQGVVESLSSTFESVLEYEIKQSLKAKIDTVVKTRLEEVMNELLDYEIQEESYYGAKKSPPTTVKNRILSDVEKHMTWKDGSYDSDRSVYTRVLRSVVEAKLKDFAKEWQKQIDAKFMADCMAHAAEQFRKRASA